METDTIANISTPLGFGGIGVIRISGPRSLEIVLKLLKRERKITPRRVHHVFLKDREGKSLGDAIVIYFKGPESYTGEDVVEIQTFGSPVLMNKILSEIISLGARLSKPGEFTERAYLSGKLDLIKAEAINKIVFSESEFELYSAVNTLEGEISERVKKWIEELTGIHSQIEGSISFPNDVEEPDRREIEEEVKKILKEIEELIEEYEREKEFIEGVNLVIFGKANVGKSSLFNILLKEERVLVSRMPGTTRDIVSEKIFINGIPFKLMDTAGVIVKVENEVDRMAIDKSKEALSKADIIILMFDGSIPLSEEDYKAVSLVKRKRFIPVINKVDLPLVISKEEIAKLTGKEPMLISCLTHEGIENLKNKLSNEFKKPNVKKLFYISLREKNILTEVLRNLKASLKETLTIDEVSIEIGEAIRKLKLLVGEEFDPDVTKEIFSRFCIGK